MTISQALHLFKHHLGHLCSCGSMVDHGVDITLGELVEAGREMEREGSETYEFKLDSYCKYCRMPITSSLGTQKDIEDEVIGLYKGARVKAMSLLTSDTELDITDDPLAMEVIELFAKLQERTLVYLVCHNAFFDTSNKGDVESTEGLISLHKTFKEAMKASKKGDDDGDQEQLEEVEGHSYIRMEVL